jgi:hypothetical protein
MLVVITFTIKKRNTTLAAVSSAVKIPEKVLEVVLNVREGGLS